MCKEKGCKTTPIFNFEGSIGMFCGKHRTKHMKINMVVVKSKPCAETIRRHCKLLINQ